MNMRRAPFLLNSVTVLLSSDVCRSSKQNWECRTPQNIAQYYYDDGMWRARKMWRG